MGHPIGFSRLRVRRATAKARANAGVLFDFAQGRLLHCAAHGEAVICFGRDDGFLIFFDIGFEDNRNMTNL
jgi:hypothetical protein